MKKEESNPHQVDVVMQNVKKAVLEDGYEIEDVLESDYGMTVKLLLSKDGEKSLLPIMECFYDTDEEGEMTEFHGVVHIADSQWYKDKFCA